MLTILAQECREYLGRYGGEVHKRLHPSFLTAYFIVVFIPFIRPWLLDVQILYSYSSLNTVHVEQIKCSLNTLYTVMTVFYKN